MSKSEHSHAVDIRDVEKRTALSIIKQKSENSNSPPRRVIRSVTVTISSQTAIELPQYDTMSRNVRRWRQNGNTSPKIPETLLELVITGEYAQTLGGENFLLYDNEEAVNRLIIFSTQSNLQFMELCDYLYMDGTFGMAPPLFKQVYTIHGT